MDPSGHHTRDSRSGADHPYSCAHGRNDQSIYSRIAATHAGFGPRTDSGGDCKGHGGRCHESREIMKVSQEPTSLETPVGDEEDSHLGDFISDPGPSPYDQTSRQLLKEHMEEVLATLSDREKKC